MICLLDSIVAGAIDNKSSLTKTQLQEKNLRELRLVMFLILQNLLDFDFTYRLGHELLLTRNHDNAVLGRAAATATAKVLRETIDWYVPHNTPSVEKQAGVFKQTWSETPTDLRYIEVTVFTEKVK